MASERTRRFSRAEKSWILYDWANSSYATIIMAAIFPIYFADIARNAGVSGDVWWGYATSVATLTVALLAPVLGAIADFRGMKKKLFSAFLLIGLVFTTTMALTDLWQLMLVGYVFSYIGFSGSLLFYDSFITDVTTADRMDKISAWGYAMGYIGGSTIPFILSIGLILFGDAIGIDGVMAVKAACLLCVVWWGVFSIPILRQVRQVHFVDKPASALIVNSLRNMIRTARDILADKAIFVFVLAYFFYIDGVNTVIHMATVYGSTLGLGTTGMILALLVTQLVAVPFSILFSHLAGRFGSIRMIRLAIIIYFIICAVGFYMGFSLETVSPASPLYAAALQRSTYLFWGMAVLVGTCQGGIQALSRSFFGKLIPPRRSNEFFGFFDIFGKFAAVMGPALYALIANLTGRSSYGILSLMVLFACGLLTLWFGRRNLALAEAKGAEAARNSREATS
jgi:UMF1 family MFS transporter